MANAKFSNEAQETKFTISEDANMNRITALLGLTVACAISLGCSMCCGPHDFDYPVLGGKHQRTNPTYGRVGSPFSDPSITGGPNADSNLEMPEFKPQNLDEDDTAPDDLDELDDIDDLDNDLDDDIMDDIDERLKQLEPIEGLEDELDPPSNPSTMIQNSANGSQATRFFRKRPVRNNQRWR